MVGLPISYRYSNIKKYREIEIYREAFNSLGDLQLRRFLNYEILLRKYVKI